MTTPNNTLNTNSSTGRSIIKSLYEANTNTNAFTDAEKQKLEALQSGVTQENAISVGVTGSYADYICDGTADDVDINAASLEAYNSTISHTVIINYGTYNTDATITLYPGVRYIFNGCKLKPTGDFDCMSNYDQSNITYNYFLDGVLEIDGTNVVSSTNNLIEFIRAYNIYCACSIYVHDSGARGVYLKQSHIGQFGFIHGDTTHDVCYIYDSCEQINVASLTSIRSISDGLDIRSSEGISVTNLNVSYSQRHGSLLSSCNRCYVQGVCFNNNQENISTYYGVGVNKASGGADSKNNIIDVVCYDDQATATQTYGILFTADTADNIYKITGTGNGSGVVSDSGTNNAQMKVRGSSGGLILQYAEAQGSEAAAASFDISVGVPSQSIIIMAQGRVDAALSQDFKADFITGNTAAIATAGTSKAQNTKFKLALDPNSDSPKTTATTNIRITGDAPFTGTTGRVTAIVYYYKTKDMDSL